jgi:predicted transport protein
MSEAKIERFFCNICKNKTKHFIRGDDEKSDDYGDGLSYDQRMLIVECCGCEHLALVKQTLFLDENIIADETGAEANWEEFIYPPVTYRNSPEWFEDLPDRTLRAISVEIYKSLQTESHYLATFGSRTLIDRLILLSVGDKGNFAKGLAALQDEGMLSQHERDILEPVVQAGHAAAHRGWAPTKDQLAIILDTVEGLIHRLLVLPKLSEELEEAVPGRADRAKAKTVTANLNVARISNIKEKIDTAPQEVRSMYDELATRLKGLGEDVVVQPQKHYVAFRRTRNFASVQIYNRKKLIRVYLNLDPDAIKGNGIQIRDVRQIGHFGTGDLEITIQTKSDIDASMNLLRASYEAS